MKILLVGTG